METRIDRYKRRKREKRIGRLKSLLILILIIFLILGIKRVNETARELDLLTDTNILYYDFYENRLEIFGSSYFLDFSSLRNLF